MHKERFWRTIFDLPKYVTVFQVVKEITDSRRGLLRVGDLVVVREQRKPDTDRWVIALHERGPGQEDPFCRYYEVRIHPDEVKFVEYKSIRDIPWLNLNQLPRPTSPTPKQTPPNPKDST